MENIATVAIAPLTLERLQYLTYRLMNVIQDFIQLQKTNHSFSPAKFECLLKGDVMIQTAKNKV